MGLGPALAGGASQAGGQDQLDEAANTRVRGPGGAGVLSPDGQLGRAEGSPRTGGGSEYSGQKQKPWGGTVREVEVLGAPGPLGGQAPSLSVCSCAKGFRLHILVELTVLTQTYHHAAVTVPWGPHGACPELDLPRKSPPQRDIRPPLGVGTFEF